MEIQKILNLYKQIGETPLERINRFKLENTKYKDLPMTYAGRLDPMAEGVLLVLVGEECKNKDQYLYLDKEYEVEVLFGFSTDTHDILGKIIETKIGKISLPKIYIFGATEKIKNIPQKYPAYSSKTFEGKPLWQWAREGEEKEITSDAKIIDIKFLNEREMPEEELLKNIEERIARVTGDFRQEEIIHLWRKALSEKNLEFKILKFRISSTGGAYMRVLASELGKILNIPSLAFSIKRTKIGTLYTIQKVLN